MNYQELSALARNQEWAAKIKAAIDIKNSAILAKRQEWLDAREGITIGDFVTDGTKEFRVAHHWGDSIQLTTGIFGASFYLGNGYIDFSGGLEPAIAIEKFKPTDERKAGAVWFFSQDSAEAHNGYYTQALFRVWKLDI